MAGSIAAPGALPAEATQATISGYGEYELDVEAVLREHLPRFFDGITPTSLTGSNIGALPDRAKGAYLLFNGDDPRPVYAGKTDGRHGFRDRLERHAWTIQGRQGLDPVNISFKAVRIMVFAALDVEALLIVRLKALMPGSLAWNNSGFGSNDPGRNRDGQVPAAFDREHPVDLDFAVHGLPDRRAQVRLVVEALKDGLPYLLRHGDIPADLAMEASPTPATARSVLTSIMQALPRGFQATILHGRVVLYREDRTYPHKLEVLRSD